VSVVLSDRGTAYVIRMGHGAIEVDEEVATRVREAMKTAGVTPHALTTLAKIPWTTLDRKLTVGSFTVRELYRIADALEVPVLALLPEAAEAAA
jgi:predicted transcriptional regulator